MLSGTEKLAEMFLGRYAVGGVSLFRRMERAKMQIAPLHIYLRRIPRPSFIKGRALQLTLPLPCTVPFVPLIIGCSKIVPLVVRPVSVFVVYLGNIVAGYKLPYNPVKEQTLPIQSASKIPRISQASGDVSSTSGIPAAPNPFLRLLAARGEMMDRTASPSKDAGGRIVTEALGKIRLIRQYTNGHLISPGGRWSETARLVTRRVVSYFVEFQMEWVNGCRR